MSSSVGYAVWAAVGLLVLALWGVSRLMTRRWAVAPPSLVLHRLAHHRWLRVALVLLWMFFVWHTFAR